VPPTSEGEPQGAGIVSELATSESQINALGVLEGELGKETCNDLATPQKGLVN